MKDQNTLITRQNEDGKIARFTVTGKIRETFTLNFLGTVSFDLAESEFRNIFWAYMEANKLAYSVGIEGDTMFVNIY